MSGDILVRLVNVTKYFRGSQLSSRILNNDNKRIEVNDVTIHLYRGETLGIIGIAGSGKSIIGKLISKVIEPSSGKVRNNSPTFLASHNHLFAARHSVGQVIESIMLTYNIPLAEYNDKKAAILKFSEIEPFEKAPFENLSLKEKSQLLIALTYFLKPDVIIYDDLAQYLDQEYKDKFMMVIDLLMHEKKAVVIIEEQPDIIPQKANYITWMSHGQVRKSGSPKEIMPLYANYLRQFHSSVGQKNEALFDLDYKMRRKTLGKENVMKRVTRHTKSILNEDFKQLLFWTMGLLLGCVVMFALVWNGVGFDAKSLNDDTSNIVKKKKSEYVEKYALAVALEDDQPIMDKNNTVVKVPTGTMLTITGYNAEDYRLSYNQKQLTVKKNHLLYINPAALYDEYSYNDLEDYMYGNYVNFREFFNSFLGKSHAVINKDLYPESNDRFVVKLTKNNIFLHFNDANKLNGISFPIVNVEGLKKKFQIKDDQWIVKIGDGYAIANFKTNHWYYYEL